MTLELPILKINNNINFNKKASLNASFFINNYELFFLAALPTEPKKNKNVHSIENATPVKITDVIWSGDIPSMYELSGKLELSDHVPAKCQTTGCERKIMYLRYVFKPLLKTPNFQNVEELLIS